MSGNTPPGPLSAPPTAAGARSAEPALIVTLYGSTTHALAVEVYQRHHAGATGRCERCGDRAPCPPRRYAASVLHAAGNQPPTTAPFARMGVDAP